MAYTDPIVPELLLNYRVYESGTNKLAGTADVELPKIENLTETMSGAGIAGEIETVVIGHIKAMSTKINFRTVVHKNFTLMNPDGVDLTIRGVIQSTVAGTGVKLKLPLVVRIKGHAKSTDFGKLEAAKTMGTSSELTVTYLKISLDGAEKLEVDPTNFIYSINGINYLADVKTMLGEV